MAEKRSRRISTFGSRVTSLVSVALVLFMLGIAAMLGLVGKNLTDEVRRNLGFVIKMERELPDATVQKLKKRLAADAGVERFDYSSAADILAEEEQYLGESVADLLDVNPYAGEFDVKVCPAYSAPDSIAVLVEAYNSAEGVHEIVTESTVIQGVDSAVRRSGAVVLAVAALLLIVSIALINNTVSLSIYGRRFVIHTMKLVGATGSFIRRPFIAAGAVNGLLAGLIAAALLWGVRFYCADLDPAVGAALDVAPMVLISLILMLVGVGICALTAAVATNRYLRASYDEMFLK